MRLRRLTFVAVCTVLLAPAAPPAAAIGLGPFEGPAVRHVRPEGARDPRDELCKGTNQNTKSPTCEPFAWIHIVITGTTHPQFTYRPYVSHTGESRDIPLGYVSNPVLPIPTSTAPATYWVKKITNLTPNPISVTRCWYGPWEGEPGKPECGIAFNVWNYWEHKLSAAGTQGSSLEFDDPAGYELGRNGNYFFPVDESNYYSVWNQDHYLTTVQHREMRGLLKHVYFDCSGPDNPTHCH